MKPEWNMQGYGRRDAMRAGLFLAVLACSGLAARAAELASPWSRSVKSQVRLVSAGPLREGRYLVGVEIAMAPQTLTYWRTPGEGGVPPTFDFARSGNLASARVRYPAPKHFVEAGSQLFGYRGNVLFPVEITPRDPKASVQLALHFNYATCDTICVPAEASLALRLSPGDPPGSGDAIMAALARVPREAAADSITVTALGGKAQPAWRLAPRNPGGPQTEFFVEGPADWYFDATRGADGSLEVTLAEKPESGAFPVDPVIVTIVDGADASEVRLRLDVPGSKP